MVQLYVRKGSAEIKVNEKLTTNAINAYEVSFEFADDWKGFNKTAVFYQTTKSKKYNVDIGNDNICYIPNELLLVDLPAYVGVVGMKNGVKKTTNYVKLEINEGADSGTPNKEFVLTVDKKIKYIRLNSENIFEYSTDGNSWSQLKGGETSELNDISINNIIVSKENNVSNIVTKENISYEQQADGTYALDLSEEVKADISQAKSDIDNLNTILAQTNTALTNTNNNVSELQTAIGETNSALEELENTVGNHTNEINGLKTSKLDKVGGTISGNLVVQGDVTVSGTTTTENVEQISVVEAMIIVNSTKVDLQTVLAGLAINKNAQATYGLVYDPTTDTVKFGEGTVDNNKKFTFKDGEGYPIGLRADSSQFTNAHLIKWNSEKNIFEDAGYTAQDLIDNVKIQTVNITLKDDATQGILTTEQFNTLLANDNNIICINNNEIYRLNDKGHTVGINTYTHDGFNEKGVTKYLNLTISTKAFIITTENNNVSVVQTTGESETSVMSQKTVTDELNKRIDKVTNTTSYNQLYSKAADGTQQMVNYDINASASTVVIRSAGGHIIANAAVTATEVVIKRQMDSAIATALGSVETLLADIDTGSGV